MALFRRKPTIGVSVLIRGRIGQGWYDLERTLKAPVGTTLREILALGEKKGVPFAEVLQASPHLAETLMLNGERCDVAENAERVMQDGDELYLLAPIAGG